MNLTVKTNTSLSESRAQELKREVLHENVYVTTNVFKENGLVNKHTKFTAGLKVGYPSFYA
jgi:hypothetical protein